MDPVATITAALAAGAIAGLKPTAEQAVRDAYAAFVGLVRRRFGSAPIDAIEPTPEVGPARERAAAALRAAGADADAEALTQAHEFLGLLARHDAAALQTVGIRLDGVRGNNLRVEGVAGFDRGVDIRNADFAGDLDFRNLTRGETGGGPNPPPRQA